MYSEVIPASNIMQSFVLYTHNMCMGYEENTNILLASYGGPNTQNVHQPEEDHVPQHLNRGNRHI